MMRIINSAMQSNSDVDHVKINPLIALTILARSITQKTRRERQGIHKKPKLNLDRVIKILFFLAYFTFSTNTPAQDRLPIGWELRREGQNIVVFGETHATTEDETSAHVVDLVRHYVSRQNILAIELATMEGFDPYRRCVDEISTERLLSANNLAHDLTDWKETIALQEDLVEAFDLVSPFASFSFWINSYSILSIRNKGLEILIPKTSEGKALNSIWSEVAHSRIGNESIIHHLESWTDLSAQWCAAPLNSRAKVLASVLRSNTHWVKLQLQRDMRLIEKKDREDNLLIQDARKYFHVCVDKKNGCTAVDGAFVDDASKRHAPFMDEDRLLTLITLRNEKMAMRLIDLAVKGPVAAIIGAAHLPTLQTKNVTIEGIISIMKMHGFSATPIYAASGNTAKASCH